MTYDKLRIFRYSARLDLLCKLLRRLLALLGTERADAMVMYLQVFDVVEITGQCLATGILQAPDVLLKSPGTVQQGN